MNKRLKSSKSKSTTNSQVNLPSKKYRARFESVLKAVAARRQSKVVVIPQKKMFDPLAGP